MFRRKIKSLFIEIKYVTNTKLGKIQDIKFTAVRMK